MVMIQDGSWSREELKLERVSVLSSKDGCDYTSLNKRWVSGIFALFASAAVIYGGKFYYSRLTTQPSVTIDLNAWAWLGDVQFRLEQESGAPTDRSLPLAMDIQPTASPILTTQAIEKMGPQPLWSFSDSVAVASKERVLAGVTDKAPNLVPAGYDSSIWNQASLKVKEAGEKVEQYMKAAHAFMSTQVTQDKQVTNAGSIVSQLVATSQVRAATLSSQTMSIVQEDAAARAIVSKLSGVAQFRDAFSPNATVDGVQSDSLTMEEDGAGWKSYHTEGYWPTVTRAVAQQQIPMISENSLQLLAVTSGARVEKQAGVVFGKVPQGWTVSVAGHSGPSTFLDEQNQAVSPFTFDGERTFVFLNSNPGAQSLILRGTSDSEQGLISIPILPGQATYVDLTQLTTRKLAGYVYDAESSEPYPLGGVQIRLSGTTGHDVLSGSDGYFEIPQVLTVADYPVFIESDHPSGFTHRYEIRPEGLDKVTLYRLGSKQVSGWLDQLEGGISSESGLLIAALPNSLFENKLDHHLFPRLTPILQGPKLVPESYTIAPSGQLEVQKPIHSQLPRFISVQLPEGPIAAEVVDEKGGLVWSHLLIAQPGIINIVSP